jgi:hypothetical protein
VIDDLPIELFGNPLIEAAITRFHMKDRELPALRGNHRKTTIRVAIEKDRVGFYFLEDSVGLGDDIADGCRNRFRRNIKKEIRFAYVKIAEKDFVELEVIILPCVHQDVIDVRIELMDNARELDDFGAGAYERQHLHRAVLSAQQFVIIPRRFIVHH